MNNKYKIAGIIGLIIVFTIVGMVKLGDKSNDLIEISENSESSDTNTISITGSDTGANSKDGSYRFDAAELVSQDDSGTVGNTDVGIGKSGGDEIDELPEKSILVHVCGEVAAPGVYELTEGSRIFEAIEAAGGFSPDADQECINQADFLSDGMKLRIPSLEENKANDASNQDGSANVVTLSGASQGDFLEKSVNSPTGTNKGTSSDSATIATGSTTTSQGEERKVNINTATKEELMTLSGVGESKANSIISYRESHGAFKRIEDIMNISGIKEGLFNKVKDSICV